MASKIKPNGYWNDFSNLERELIAFIEEHGTPSVMPTYTEFKKARRGDLARAVSKHGGFPSVAARLGLESTYKAKPPGYWDDFFNLSNELLAFVESYGVSGVMPTQPELRQAGRSDLIEAIKRNGGHRSVSEKLDLAYEKRQPGYWQDPSNFERELFDFIKEYGTPGRMPTKPELLKAGRGDLQIAISSHGGFNAVAEQFGLIYAKKRHAYWNEFANVEREIHAFIEEKGNPGVMPKTEELSQAGRKSLIVAIKQHGGFPEVAKRLGLNLSYERKPPGHWQDLSNVKQELFSFAEKLGTPGIMPRHEELQEAGRSDLISAIVRCGGYPSAAKQLGLKLTYKRNPKDKWDDFNSLKDELLSFVEQQGIPGRMPIQKELTEAGRTDLNRGIQKHGGWQPVAERLELTYSKRQPAYWDDFAKVKLGLLGFIEKRGNPGVMPTSEELRKAGHGALGKAIQKHGGYPSVAAKLGLELAYTKKPADYWEEFANLERELLTFIEKKGASGVMPTKTELYNARLSSLGYAIQRHGGFSVVARRLGLAYTDKEYVTPRTASEVEKTARAIQPLAESNLLSGAQVMVILRRAGLLEYRNKLVVRLGASLARGNHDEIESAISQLASTSEEITTETDNLEESENLTAEEAEALVNSGLESTENPPLDKSSPEPDTQREQAVIRGLTALGELRLPLDEVLSLLTSKLLWQAFYKRLYNWYGGLDAAQNITAEDVEAAILSTYPEHTDNEFVAEASARFILEVEQAVNFAASLPNYDWHGFRLRLHQADAARRMAEVLTNQDSDQYCPNRVNLTPPTPLPCKGRGESGSPLLAGEGLGERSTKQYRNTDYPFLLNADDPGMGKSASFLAAVCACGIKSVVLIAPKTVADDTWCGTNGEIHRCLPHAKIVRGLDKTLTASPSSRLTFYVLHYEELLKSEAIATLAEQSFDCLCLDEIHFIKKRAGQQDGSLRREALKDLRQAAGAAIGLTGTPLINELAEPMSLLQTLSNDAPQFDHSRLSNRRLSDIADVFEALLPHIIRRRKRSVLLHLPSCDVQPVDIPLPEEIEQQMQETHKWPKSRATEQLNELRKLATEAKLAYLQQQAESARKLLILTYLTDEVSEKIAQYLEEFLPNQVAHINGQTPKDERQKQLDSFRHSDGVRVLVGTIRTIGTGLTLFDPSADDTANQIIIADLPYTWAEFEQGIARLHREGQKHRVCVSVLQTKMLATRGDGSAYHTIDEQIWALIQGKRELSDVAVDGKYDTTGAAAKVQKALRRWLKQTREMGVEPRRVERRSDEPTEAQKWRNQIAQLRGMTAAKADERFADPEYTRQFLAHLKNSPILELSHQWLRGKLSLLLRPDLTLIDMGCGLNPFADLPCRLIGLDRHHQPEQLSSQYVRGKMENPPLPDKSADVLIYSLSLFGTPSDLMAYFTQAVRILRGGGHLFIVEPDSTFTPEGLTRFIRGLFKVGFELVGSVKDLWSQDGAKLKGMHFTLTGEMGQPEEADFERK